MKCVFFGSPQFAVPFLKALFGSKKHTVVGVVTQPDRPAKRGLSLEAPPVKSAAQELNIPVFQPEKINEDPVLAWLTDRSPDILVVVAYGEFLGKKLLGFCKTPPINLHPSLLPELRGAAPVQWAIILGKKETGVSIQFMSPKMDAGDILLQETVLIDSNETAEDLFTKVTPLGQKLLIEALDKIEAGTATTTHQKDSDATLAPLLTKDDGLIRWQNWTAEECHNRIRGLFPWPAAFTYFQGKRIKVLKSSVSRQAPWGNSASPGDFVASGDQLLVRCKSGVVELSSIQPEGKRPMLPREFVNGIQNKTPPYAFDGAEPGK